MHKSWIESAGCGGVSWYSWASTLILLSTLLLRLSLKEITHNYIRLCMIGPHQLRWVSLWSRKQCLAQQNHHSVTPSIGTWHCIGVKREPWIWRVLSAHAHYSCACAIYAMRIIGKGRHDTLFPWRSCGRLQLIFDLKLRFFVRRRTLSTERAWGATKGMKTLWNILLNIDCTKLVDMQSMSWRGMIMNC